jgi:hypothetical protein
LGGEEEGWRVRNNMAERGLEVGEERKGKGARVGERDMKGVECIVSLSPTLAPCTMQE